MNKIAAWFRVLQVGQAVASPARWKAGQIGVNALAGFLLSVVALASAYGYPIPATPGQAEAVAAGLLAVFNILFTVATTEKIGLPARAAGDGDSGIPKLPPVRWGDDETHL